MLLTSEDIKASLDFYYDQACFVDRRVGRFLCRLGIVIVTVVLVALACIEIRVPMPTAIWLRWLVLVVAATVPLWCWKYWQKQQVSLPDDVAITAAINQIKAMGLHDHEEQALLRLLRALEQGVREDIVAALPSQSTMPKTHALQFVNHVRNGLRDGMYK